MRRGFALTSVLLLAVSTGACEDVGTSVDPEPRTASQPDVAVSPSAVLSAALHARSLQRPSGAPSTLAGGDFASPLFGLATAPNGDIVVADAGAGIAVRSGATEIPLPGVTDMSPIGRGSMWATEGLTGMPGDDTGQGLFRVSRGNVRRIADLFAFEAANNPDGADLIDSNPFDVHSLGGNAALVADAAGNDLLRVSNRGEIDVLAVLPDELVPTDNVKALLGCPAGPPGICGLPPEIPAQAVATSVAVGPDGHYYVGELKGFPAPVAESNIWRVSPDASDAACGSSSDCVKAFDGGFTSIIDLAFGPDGMLYVVELDEQSWFALELSPPGGLVGGTINACDVDALTCAEVATGIPMVTAVTFGTDGTLWATKNALIPGAAEVVPIP